MRTSARPRPVLGSGDQARGNGVVLDVRTDALELSGTAHPVIEGFILPEPFSLTPQNPVGVPRAHSLDAVRDPREGGLRSDQDVDMVRHDHERVKDIMSQDTITALKSVSHACGDARVLEPAWAFKGFVECCVNDLRMLFGSVPYSRQVTNREAPAGCQCGRLRR